MHCSPWGSEEMCDVIEAHGFRLPWPAKVAHPSHFPIEKQLGHTQAPKAVNNQIDEGEGEEERKNRFRGRY